VPAVAVRQERLVLFIFNRFKGYVDGINCLIFRLQIILEFSYKRGRFRINSVKIKFVDTFRTGKSEGNPLCKN